MKDTKVWKALAMAGKLFIGVSLMLMVMMVFVNAVDRYFFKGNVPVFEELSRYLFVWVAFLGAMLGYSEGKHVGVDIIISRLRGKVRLFVGIFAEVVILGCVAVLGHGALTYFGLTWSNPSPSSGIPYGMISGMAIIMAVFFIVITVRDVGHTIKAYKNGDFDKIESLEDKIHEMADEYGVEEE